MAARTVSPGAALLRTSRMFSLPNPIPSPPGDAAVGMAFSSDTATTAFPQYQVITTPQSSRKHGDWGLKRPLPLKTTLGTSTPAIRVKRIDAIERITDFSSASDHALSLKKYQALNLPLSVPSSQKLHVKLPTKSVFEEDGDFTAFDRAKAADAKDQRWKFGGPWLAGIPEGRFKRYVEKHVRMRKSEFRQFLRAKLAEELTEEKRRKSLDQGVTVAEPVSASSVTESELNEYVRRLRYERTKLYDFVGEFLDLAPIQPDESLDWGSPWRTKELSAGNPYAREGPPIMHPSGGISYLRSDAYLDNHPIYGPQKAHPPVKARFIVPRNNSGKGARLGIGGFVTNVPEGRNIFAANNGSGGAAQNDLSRFDPDVVGGSKAYVRLLKANVDSQGRVLVEAAQADQEATLVAEEMAGEAEVYNRKPPPVSETVTGTQSWRPRRPSSRNTVMGSQKTYGLSL